MLKDKCFELDSKGILADDYFSEDYYAEYGDRLLDLFQDESLFRTVMRPIEKKFRIEGWWNVSPEVDNKLKRLGFDMGWIPVFYGEGRRDCRVYTAGTFYEEKHNLLVPVVVCNTLILGEHAPLSFLNFESLPAVVTHELIHAARANISEKAARGTYFEELMADYFKIIPNHDLHWRSIRQTIKDKFALSSLRKKLEDMAGGNSEYIIGRMKKKEFYEMNGKAPKQIKDYIKGKKGLRFQIIKEKLDL